MDGRVVVFGGGKVGLRKVNYLSKFTRDIIVVAEENLPMPEHVSVKTIHLDPEDIPDIISGNIVLVIAALSDMEMNRKIAKQCRDRDIPVNVVDDPNHSTVLFPALSKAGDVNVAVSTSGRCPFLARKIREEVDSWVAEKALWLEVLAPIRDKITGIDEKNRVLTIVYEDQEISNMVKEGNLEEAKEKALEVYDVHS